MILKWMETWSQLCRAWSQNLGRIQNHFEIISDANLNGNGHYFCFVFKKEKQNKTPERKASLWKPSLGPGSDYLSKKYGDKP